MMKGKKMLLPDFSEWQRNVNIPGVRQQTSAIIQRVGYGHDHKDLVIDHFRPLIVKEKFRFVGLYQYLVAGQDPTAQAEAFCSWVGTLNRGEIPILDLEEGTGNQLHRAELWFNYVDHHFGLYVLPLNRRSWLYSGASFAVTSGLISIFNSARHTWVAAYGSREPSLPHSLWQSTNGVVGAYKTYWAGAGYVDTNYTKHTIEELASYAYQPSTPSPVSIPSKEVDVIILRTVMNGVTVTFTYDGTYVRHIVSPQDQNALAKVLPVVDVTEDQVKKFNGGTLPTM